MGIFRFRLVSFRLGFFLAIWGFYVWRSPSAQFRATLYVALLFDVFLDMNRISVIAFIVGLIGVGLIVSRIISIAKAHD